MDLFKKAYYIQKISEIEIKIPSISGLVTTFALTAVKNKITDVSNLVKKKTLYTKNKRHWKERYWSCPW